MSKTRPKLFEVFKTGTMAEPEDIFVAKQQGMLVSGNGLGGGALDDLNKSWRKTAKD